MLHRVSTSPLILDGHNDVLTCLWTSGSDDFSGPSPRAIDVAAARAGGFGGGFFAVWVPGQGGGDNAALMQAETYDIDLPPMVTEFEAGQVVEAQVAILEGLEAAGHLTICRDVAEIEATFETDRLAAILHIEGAEAIGPDMALLERLYERGLRSLGPVWSRETIFGHGVPFRFPSSPDTGPGLTDAGKRLVAKCDEMGVMMDLSHLNEAGFWDVARQSRRPLVATHSCVHAICAHARNLTDAQLDAIGGSDGMVGLNFGVAFLRPDGRKQADVSLGLVLDHLDHLIDRLGEDRVGFGSDYDGTLVPEALTTAADLPNLRLAMIGRGYSADRIEKLCHRNWLRVLAKSWAA